MDYSPFLSEVFWGSLGMLKTIAIFLFPILIGVEIIDEVGILDKISSFFAPLLKIFKLSKDASVPLIVAQVFGITYGAGVILRVVEDDRLTKSELITVAIFLMASHALIEDTILFVAVGGKAWIMLGVRILMAVIITYLYAKFFVKDERFKAVSSDNSCET